MVMTLRQNTLTARALPALIPAALILAALALPGFAARAAGPAGWMHQEFSDASGPAVGAAQSWLNTACQPSGLDGVQMFAIQSGHGQTFNFHIYCRADHDPAAHYRVSLTSFPKARFGALIDAAVRDPNLRVGPFFFGNPGGPDGMVIVEKLAAP